jgi:hypothetical protein
MLDWVIGGGLVAHGLTLAFTVGWTAWSIRRHGWRKRSTRRYSYYFYISLHLCRLVWLVALARTDVASGLLDESELQAPLVGALNRVALCLCHNAFSMVVFGWANVSTSAYNPYLPALSARRLFLALNLCNWLAQAALFAPAAALCALGRGGMGGGGGGMGDDGMGGMTGNGDGWLAGMGGGRASAFESARDAIATGANRTAPALPPLATAAHSLATHPPLDSGSLVRVLLRVDVALLVAFAALLALASAAFGLLLSSKFVHLAAAAADPTLGTFVSVKFNKINIAWHAFCGCFGLRAVFLAASLPPLGPSGVGRGQYFLLGYYLPGE